MKPQQTKFVCDLISTVANAAATNTVDEAVDYLVEKYNNVEDPILEHTYNILSQLKNKTYQNEELYGTSRRIS